MIIYGNRLEYRTLSATAAQYAACNMYRQGWVVILLQYRVYYFLPVIAEGIVISASV